MFNQDKEILKLSKLCEHWALHNNSHRENFEKWRDIIEEKGLLNVVNNLNKAIEMINDCNSYLLNAKRELDKL